MRCISLPTALQLALSRGEANSCWMQPDRARRLSSAGVCMNEDKTCYTDKSLSGQNKPLLTVNSYNTYNKTQCSGNSQIKRCGVAGGIICDHSHVKIESIKPNISCRYSTLLKPTRKEWCTWNHRKVFKGKYLCKPKKKKKLNRAELFSLEVFKLTRTDVR